MSHSDVIRASSLSPSQDHVPDLVVSLASSKNDFTFETVVSNSPPSRIGKAWHYMM